MEQRPPINPSPPSPAKLLGYNFQNAGESPGLSPSGSYDLKDFPINSDWDRFDLFFDGTLFRILVFKLKSQTTLFQGTFDPQNGCFQYGLQVDKEISLVDITEGIDLQDFIVLGKGMQTRLLLRDGKEKHKLYDFPYDPNRKAYRPGQTEHGCSAFEWFSNGNWEGWKSCSPADLLFKMWSLSEENILANTSLRDTQSSSMRGSRCFSVIPNGTAFRLYTVETTAQLEPQVELPEQVSPQQLPPPQSLPPSALPENLRERQAPELENAPSVQNPFGVSFPAPNAPGIEEPMSPAEQGNNLQAQGGALGSTSNMPNSPQQSLDSEINLP